MLLPLYIKGKLLGGGVSSEGAPAGCVPWTNDLLLNGRSWAFVIEPRVPFSGNHSIKSRECFYTGVSRML